MRHLAALLLGLSSMAIAQVPIPPAKLGHQEPYYLRSGNHANPYPIETVVYRELISLAPNTPWLRLQFSRVQLAKGSYLRMSAMRDGAIQEMHQIHLEQWNFASAFFNGHAVLLEVVAGPNTEKNYVEIDKIHAGDDPATVHEPDGICFLTDDRAPTSHAAVGRLMTSSGGACTGWIIDRPVAPTNDKVHLSAGHCFPGGSPVLQFNVPSSNADCSINQPPPSRQFAVDTATMVFVNGGLGNDYAVFRCFPNPVTGLTTFQQQGSAIALGAPPGFLGNVEVIGYGVDGTNINNASGANNSCTCTPSLFTGQRNLIQQNSQGPLMSSIGTMATYQADTCPGTSGGPAFHVAASAAFAINTHSGCELGGANIGTLISAPGVQAAIGTVAGPTSSDECGGAIPIFDGTNGLFNNTGMTTSQPSFPCISTGADVWFSYVATCNGNVTFDTCTVPHSFDTVLQVFSGDCNGLTSLGCSDDFCGTGSSVTASLQSGQRYMIRVGGYVGATGTFGIGVWGCGSANECIGAVPLQIGGNGPFRTNMATTSAPGWPCAGGGNDLWFSYQAPAWTAVTFDTCNAVTNYDTAIEVFTGSCGSLTSVICNDDSSCVFSNYRSSATATTTVAQTFYVRVGGYSGATGTFQLDVTQSPLNTDCAGNTPLVADGINGPYSNLNGGISGVAWPCAPAQREVWFHYVAPLTGLLTANTCSAVRNFDTVIAVYANCSTSTALGCNDDSCGQGSSVTVQVTQGVTYYLRVGGRNAEQGNFELTLATVPVNDECQNAITVGIGTNGPFSSAFATTSTSWTCAYGGNDVWFRYQAGATAPHTFTTCTPTRSFDTILQVFQGPCSSLTSVACIDDACGLGSAVTANLTNGQVYFIRVGGYGYATGSFDLTVATGTGTGSFGSLATGCGAATLSASGNPNIGGTSTFQLSGVVGLPFIGMGFAMPNSLLCAPAGCRLGSDWMSSSFGATRSLTIPADASFIGVQVSVQGLDLFAPGGCPAGYTVTNTAVVTIG
jgi:hypothetical protein